ncbi:hypothetical protein ACFE04_003248 [Oxalis oulophora]
MQQMLLPIAKHLISKHPSFNFQLPNSVYGDSQTDLVCPMYMRVWDIVKIANDPTETRPGLYGGDFGDVPNDLNFCLNGITAVTPQNGSHAHGIHYGLRLLQKNIFLTTTAKLLHSKRWVEAGHVISSTQMIISKDATVVSEILGDNQ